MVGSRDSIASPNVVLNTIVAQAFHEAADILEAAGEERFEETVHDLIKRYAAEHIRIVFNGNGYSESWVTEARRRGLPNLPSMVDAVAALTTERAVKLFTEFGVFSRKELESRMEIKYETYSKDIHIEARTMLELTGKYFLPAMIRGSGKLAEFINAVEQAGGDASVQRNLLTELSGLIKTANEAKRQLEEVTKQAERHPAGRTQAVLYRDNVVPAMEALRKPVDAAEMILDKDMWPVPSYADLMFEI